MIAARFTSTRVLSHGAFTLATAAAVVLLTGSCAVDRRLTIQTDPPGADVIIDGLGLGTSPVHYKYTHYGVRRIRVEYPGYVAIERLIDLNAPWYGAIPFDFFSEILIPVWRTDYRDVTLQLTPLVEEPPTPDAKAQDAEAIARARAWRRWIPEEPSLPSPVK